MKQQSISQFFAFLLLACFGSAITVIGLLLAPRDIHYQPFMLSIGGALMGIGITGGITSFEALNHWLHLRSILTRLIGSKLLSEESQIEKLRRRYHHYYVTSRRGDLVWNHDIIDFGQPNPPGILSASSAYEGRDNNIIPSRADAFVVDGRFVMRIKDMQHDEPSDICVFPFFSKPGDDSRCGFELRETLDHTHMLCPAILSPCAINKWNRIGTVCPETAKILGTLWREMIVMPNVGIAWVNHNQELERLQISTDSTH